MWQCWGGKAGGVVGEAEMLVSVAGIALLVIKVSVRAGELMEAGVVLNFLQHW